MKKETLDSIRNEYFEQAVEYEKLKNLSQKFQELENDPIVKEYLQLKEEIFQTRSKLISEKGNFFNTLRVILNRYRGQLNSEASNFYIYSKSLYFSKHVNEVLTCKFGSEDENCRIYYNLESGEPLKVPKMYFDKFEEENKIVYPSTPVGSLKCEDARFEYMITAMTEGVEEAEKKITMMFEEADLNKAPTKTKIR